ncbi:MAG TPA: sigma-70 family RNA polymerase sigma factor, partial [Bacillota bacterium]|nr:sigma-70 family RNA polymerase sigma factor [Bacillota bacterium]
MELNGGLVRSIAIRFRDRGTEIEDLIQIGMIGMIKAVNSFDTSRGTAFSTYAVPLIIGEIRRHLRDAGIIKVSRSYKKLGMTLMRERSRILSDE